MIPSIQSIHPIPSHPKRPGEWNAKAQKPRGWWSSCFFFSFFFLCISKNIVFYFEKNVKIAHWTPNLATWGVPRGLPGQSGPKKHSQGVSWSVRGVSRERLESFLRAAYSCISFTKRKIFLFWKKKREDHKLNNDFGNMRPTNGPPWQKWAQKAFPGCVRERLGSLAGAAYPILSFRTKQIASFFWNLWMS